MTHKGQRRSPILDRVEHTVVAIRSCSAQDPVEDERGYNHGRLILLSMAPRQPCETIVGRGCPRAR